MDLDDPYAWGARRIYRISNRTDKIGRSRAIRYNRSLLRFPVMSPSQCGGRTFESEPRDPGFEPRSGQLVFPLGKEINRYC